MPKQPNQSEPHVNQQRETIRTNPNGCEQSYSNRIKAKRDLRNEVRRYHIAFLNFGQFVFLKGARARKKKKNRKLGEIMEMQGPSNYKVNSLGRNHLRVRLTKVMQNVRH